MRALLQRVSSASVTIDGVKKSQIGRGICVFLGVAQGDTQKDVAWLAEKIANLRIFDDDGGKMNRSVLDDDREVLVVSQFTLFADYKKGRRPSWGSMAKLELANSLYKAFIKELVDKGVKTGTGVFQTHMSVCIDNDGPVTIMIDSKE